MLTALELHGFKSFADRTRFDFPSGITVVVGPNGSGKSNVVDGIKWVLGTQSPKSLRGSEMTDVIFKGSSAGRKPLNTAEATIVFDNADGRLPVEEKEVRVTRRVYRSGEGEYLLNGQPCRLRDIKDLFRGTGVGTDAYSIIEQGKVSAMLQASAKDRRAIFEEAAGISRFKAKKVETERRLARVDQNLLRLSDIVDEVESRLRSVRSQAAKAQRYKEYNDRLQQLRTQVGMTDWRKLTQQLQAAEAELASHREALDGQRQQADEQSRSLYACNADMAKVDAELRDLAGQITDNREQVAGVQSSVEHQRARAADVQEEAARFRRQLGAMCRRANEFDQQRKTIEADVEIARADHARRSSREQELSAQIESLAAELEAAQDCAARLRREQAEQSQVAAELANRYAAARLDYEAAAAAAQRARETTEDVIGRRERLGEQLVELESQQRAVAANLQTQDRQVQDARDDLQR
ncbi:MAG: AAA family ATPase, partial [Planctomycetales bacterium]|nr:AAA family ATPase [Planctomycetales bacterium]